MTRSSIRLPHGAILAAIGLAALVMAIRGDGLRTPPESKAVFVAFSAVLIAGALALVSVMRQRFARRTNLLGTLARVGAPALLIVLLLIAYRFQTSITLIRYENYQYETNQPALVFMPLWLPKALKEDVIRLGSRSAVVSEYTPSQIEDELKKNELPRAITSGVMALNYGLLFACVAVVGGFVASLVGGGVAPAAVGVQRRTGVALDPATPSDARDRAAFICHSSKDADAASAICEYLESTGLKCWIAPRDVGFAPDYWVRLNSVLRDIPALVLVFSENANQSTHVILELDTALGERKPIFMACLDDATPSEAIGPRTRISHRTHVGNPPELPQLARLAAALTAARRPAVPAPAAATPGGSDK